MRTALSTLFATASLASLAGCHHDGHSHASAPSTASASPVTEVGLAIPIRAGQTEAWRRAIVELTGPRYDEYEASRRRMGITSQTTFLQQTPMGDFAVIHLTGPDVHQTFRAMAESQDPWDVSWRRLTENLHGFDFGKGEAVAPKVELAFSTSSADAGASAKPYMFIVPVVDLGAFRALAADLGGRKREAYERSRARIGVQREAAFLETTAAGSVVVVYWRAAEPAASLAKLGASDDAFDRWLLAAAGGVHGMNLDTLPIRANPLVGQYPKAG